MAAFTTETGKAAALTKVRRAFRTRLNVALLALDECLDKADSLSLADDARTKAAARAGAKAQAAIAADLAEAVRLATAALGRVPNE
jgi:hypothetical protein